MEAGDVAANAGDSVTIDGVTYTTLPLFEDTAYDTDYLCTTVTVENNSEEVVRISEYGWRLQDPRGTLNTQMTINYDTRLEQGEIASGGGVTSGDMCFQNRRNAPGTYVVIYDPANMFDRNSEDRGRIGWTNSR